MADDSAVEVNGTSDKTGSQASTADPDETQLPEMSGWLLKRTKMSHKWRKQWFHLKQTELLYGDTAENLPKKIPLLDAEISESTVDSKDNAFRIKPKDGKRIFYMCADDESSQHNWMQAICFAKATGSTGDSSQACILQ